MMHTFSLDHIVLTVSDIDVTCEFYERVVGADIVAFGNGRRALQFGGQKINLHQAGSEIEPHAATPTRGAGDICVLTDVPIELVVEHLRLNRVPIVLGPVDRQGAVSPLRSIYIRDPDGNLVEIANQAC